MPDMFYAIRRAHILARLAKDPCPRLTSIHPRYRDDPEVVARYTEKWAGNYGLAGEQLRLDKEFFKRLAPTRSILQFADESIRDDIDCVRAALRNPLEFRYASKRLQCNRELVLMAAIWAHTMLDFACDELKNDKEIVAAVEESRVRQQRCDSHWRW